MEYVTLRWHIKNGIIPIPKTSNKERMKENLNLFDFEILNEDMKIIDSLNKDECVSTFPDGTIY